jgi:hypothetical protein
MQYSKIERGKELDIIANDPQQSHTLSAEVFKLAKRLRKMQIISIPDVCWEDRDKSDEEEAADSSHFDFIAPPQGTLKNYAVHPDLPDQLEWSSLVLTLNFIGQLSNTRWCTVNKRQKLKAKAVTRLGFLFKSYKVCYWFWEIIEMLRK